jgi:intron-binding protein aquarius
LYIVGRRDIFETCYELRSAFELLLQRPDKLVLSTGEMWPSSRVLAEEEGAMAPNEAVMEGVEHLGQFVYEMTVSKVKQLRAERGLSAEEEVGEAALQPIREEDEVQYVDAASDEEDEEQEEMPQNAGDRTDE